MHPITIIGSGLAAYTVARELRKRAAQAPLRLISRDSADFYSKPMLSNALSKGKTAPSLVNTPAAQMAEELKAEILARRTVQAIEPGAHAITVDGELLQYSALVLALGSDSLRPVLAGDAAADILQVNDLDDFHRLEQALAGGPKRVAILGGGLIGCEFANDLIGAGHQVRVIDRGAAPLGRLVPQAVGEALQRALVQAGVHWHANTEAVSADRHANGVQIGLRQGGEVQADIVLSALGLCPRTALAAAAGLRVARGIVVDDYLQSSAQDVYALGDCAEVDGQVQPFVLPIMHGARALAATLSGEPTAVRYPPMPVVVKTPAYPITVLPPAPNTPGEWRVTPRSDGIQAEYRDHDSGLRGFALGGGAVAQKNALLKEITGSK
ncbi:MAG: FAD-dependent oxidoreductase [Pseudomonadota bacterium]